MERATARTPAAHADRDTHVKGTTMIEHSGRAHPCDLMIARARRLHKRADTSTHTHIDEVKLMMDGI